MFSLPIDHAVEQSSNAVSMHNMNERKVWFMENEIFKFLRSLDGLGLGTGIIMMCVCFAIAKTVAEVIKRFKERVLKKAEKDRTFQSLVDDNKDLKKMVKDLCSSISDLQSELKDSHDKLNTKIDNIQEQLNAVKKCSNEEDVKLKESVSEMSDNLEKVTAIVDNLVGSDMERNRAYIVSAYNKYVVMHLPIDIYTYQTIKDAYVRYTKDGGNSFISDLIKDFDKLEKNMLNAEYNEELGTIKVIHGLPYRIDD